MLAVDSSRPPGRVVGETGSAARAGARRDGAAADGEDARAGTPARDTHEAAATARTRVVRVRNRDVMGTFAGVAG